VICLLGQRCPGWGRMRGGSQPFLWVHWGERRWGRDPVTGVSFPRGRETSLAASLGPGGSFEGRTGDVEQTRG